MTRLALLACAALAACGGGAESTSQIASAQPATALVAIGNSITFIPAQAGWTPGRGMAASDLAHDYVHVAAAALGLPVAAQRNAASLELPANDPINKIDSKTPLAQQIATAVAGIGAGSDVVIELGDNAWTPPSSVFDAFAGNYAALLDAVAAAHPHALACVSTWWRNATKDAAMQAACEAHRGTWVAIGDIFPTRTDTIPAGEDQRITGHPHDSSMAIIGARVAAALGSES